MMNWFRKRYALPTQVRELLAVLQDAGYEAYAVGGCVRDTLLGREPHDWDITTAARPEEVTAVFRAAGYEVVPQVGTAFAVSVVRTAGAQYEVATFRGERYGEDSHRPETVYYADSLAEDVARRDFTVNAMALDAEGRLYDFYEGKRDLNRQVLRTVGEPAERFREDALRLFRACRFTAELGFRATPELCAAMPAAFGRVAGLSLERVRGEVERILVAPYAARGMDLLVRSGLAARVCSRRVDGRRVEVPILPELAHLPATVQASGHRYDAWLHTLVVLEHTPPVLEERWAALFHDVAKGLPGIRGEKEGEPTDYGHDREGARMAQAVLTRWGYRQDFVDSVAFSVAMHMKYHYFVNNEEADAERWLRRLARSGRFRRQADMTAALARLGRLCVADVIGCGRPESATAGHEAFGEYMADLAATMPVHTRDLHYPPELPKRCGALTGECLRVLLKRVQDGQLANEPAALLAAALRHKARVEKGFVDGEGKGEETAERD